MTRIRVLIVDDAAPVRETIRRMLELEDDLLVVGEAADGEEAVHAARKLLPDVVLMDINMPRMDGITATRAILAEVATSVIMVSVEGDREYLRRAMQAGARDFLVKPFSPEDLAQTIRQAARERGAPGEARPGRGRVVTVFGTKGGVGRTTVAANLAAALALGGSGRGVVLADLDLEFGVLAQVLSLRPSSSIVDLCRSPEPITVRRVAEVLARHPELNLSLLAAPPLPHLAAEVDGEGRLERGRNYVEETLRALREGWEAVVVDTATGFREATLAALDLADTVLLVTAPDIPSLHNAAKGLTILQQELGFPREKVRVVVNLDGIPGGLAVEDVAEALEFPVSLALPFDRAVAVAVNAGQPVLARRSRSAFGQAITRLAGMLRDESQGERAPAAPERAVPGSGLLRPFLQGSRPRTAP